jgi:hypothetical protein
LDVIWLLPPPPPPQPASASVSSNPAASGTREDCHRLTPSWFRRLIVQAIAGSANASINRPPRPGDKGRTGGRGRERGAPADAAVVVTVTVTFVAELPTVNGFGETVHVASEGAPVQARLIVADNPPSPPTLKV